MSLFRNCFAGKNILITGASRGLGRALVGVLHDSDANVFALARDETRLRLLKAQFPKITHIAVDLRDWNATQKAVSEIPCALDGVVNNAGAGTAQGLMKVSAEDLNTAFHTHIGPVISIAQIVVPKMIESGNGGSIVNISSMVSNAANALRRFVSKCITTSIRGTPIGLPYSVTKCGLNMLTRIMAVELGKHKIRVNTVCPAGFESDLLVDAMNEHFGTYGMAIRNKAMVKRTPLGKPLLELNEIVNATLFVLSDLVPMMTGESLLIDGGFTCT